jgi:hypothetical protein
VAITDVLFRKQDILAWSPAKKLQYAVLTDALASLRLRNIGHNTGVSEETLVWIASKEQDYVFSFEYCCRSFDLSPEATRKALLANEVHMEKEMVQGTVPR